LLHIFFALFCLTSAWLTYTHVPWRDEAQAWLMAKSLNPWGLFLEARHDGHPILWHLCLKGLQSLGMSFPSMMVLNWLFIIAGIGLLLYCSTLPLLVRLLVAFCPACLLEISYNARNYAIAIALIFLAATLYSRARRKPLAFRFVLALLANTNVYAAAVFVGIAVQFMLEQACDFGESPFSIRPLYTRYLAANLILLASALLLVAQLAPITLPSEPSEIRGPHLSPVFLLGSPAVIVWIVLICTFLPLFFVKTPGFPRIVGSAIAGLLALLPMLSHSVHTRHIFMLAVGIVYFYWIYYDDLLRADFQPRFVVGLQKSTAAWTLLIAIAVIACQPGGLRYATKKDSDSTAAAVGIINHKLDRPDVLLFATDPTKASSLLFYLKNIVSIYSEPPYPSGPMPFPDYFYTHALGKNIPTLEEVKPLIVELAHSHPNDTLLLCAGIGDPGFTSDDQGYRLRLVYRSTDGPAFRKDTELYQIYSFGK
jgi:hypothetical protein